MALPIDTESGRHEMRYSIWEERWEVRCRGREVPGGVVYASITYRFSQHVKDQRLGVQTLLKASNIATQRALLPMTL